MFFSAAAAFTQTRGLTEVYSEFINSSRAKELDCSAAFLNSLDALAENVGPVRFNVPFRGKTKKEMVEMAKHLCVPIGRTFSCQVYSDIPCGACPNCVERNRRPRSSWPQPMTPSNHPHNMLDALALARQIANHAETLGIGSIVSDCRFISDHLGAVLANFVLQAGLNYRTVVKARIERIVGLFPEAATLRGTIEIIEKGAVSDFLLWKHPEKIDRFVRLVRLLENYKIENTQSLEIWLQVPVSRDHLLKVVGIGPKTVDYLCCLVGMDCIAVDRHVSAFARDAGVDLKDYDGLKLVVSYAADLLGVSRRDFNSWIWRSRSIKAARAMEASFNSCELRFAEPAA